MPVTTDEFLEKVRAWAKSHHPDAAPRRVRVDFVDGEKVQLLMPPDVSALAAVPPPVNPLDQLTECQRDILDAVRAAEKRLTGEDIKRALQAAEKLHGDSTINHTLAEMIKAGLLTNRKDSYGKGYGLPEWS